MDEPAAKGHDLLDQVVDQERAKWSTFLGRALLTMLLAGAAVDALDAVREGSGLATMLATRGAGTLVILLFVATGRRARLVATLDGRARAVGWAVALLLAIDVGALGRLPIATALLSAWAAFLPAGMRRVTARRWGSGAIAWLAIAFTTGLLVRGTDAVLTTPSLAALATGPALIAGFFVLARLFSVGDHFAASSLEARSIGRYALLRRLGVGGMGQVWEAHHPALKATVALKLLRIESPTALARFEAEASLTAQLVHPSTVRVYDYGRIGDGLAYYVMERVPGMTLKALVEAEGPMTPGRALDIVRQIANALSEAHGKGLIHRDIKPENVLACTECGEPDLVKLIDFGLVFRPNLPLSEDTGGGAIGKRLSSRRFVLGTPAYMAPEIALGEEASSASDVYSLGCLLYFLLTGEPPFGGTSAKQQLTAHVLDVADAPSDVGDVGLPAEVDALVARCMDKRASERPTSGRALNAEIARAMAACRSLARASGKSVASSSTSAKPPTVEEPVDESAKPA